MKTMQNKNQNICLLGTPGREKVLTCQKKPQIILITDNFQEKSTDFTKFE